MNMKYFVLLMLMFTGWLSVPASAEEREAMVVETKGGDEVLFLFEQKPEMTFSGENVEIKSTKETVLYPMEDVAQIKFEQISTGIGNVNAGDVSFRFTDGQLEAEGLAPQSAVTVYSADGTARLSSKADASGKAMLQTDSLPKGIYIVKTDKVTYKIIKK